MAFLAAALLLSGTALLVCAKLTPWHSSEAYFTELERLTTEWSGASPDFARMSRDYHALQDRYETPKWKYADGGYLSLALGVVIAACATAPAGALTRTADRRVTLVLFALAHVGFWASVSIAAFQTYGREQVPPWSDAVAIPLFSGINGAKLYLAPMAAILLWPLLCRRVPRVSLFYWRREKVLASSLCTLIYAAIALGFAALAALFALGAGSWLATPSLILFAWLALNTRARAIAPSAPC